MKTCASAIESRPPAAYRRGRAVSGNYPFAYGKTEFIIKLFEMEVPKHDGLPEIKAAKGP